MRAGRRAAAAGRRRPGGCGGAGGRRRCGRALAAAVRGRGGARARSSSTPPRPPPRPRRPSPRWAAPRRRTLPPFARRPRHHCSLLDIDPASTSTPTPPTASSTTAPRRSWGACRARVPGRAGYVRVRDRARGRVCAGPRVPAGLDAGGRPAYRLAAAAPQHVRDVRRGRLPVQPRRRQRGGRRDERPLHEVPARQLRRSGGERCASPCPVIIQRPHGPARVQAVPVRVRALRRRARCMGCYYGRPFCSEGFTPQRRPRSPATASACPRATRPTPASRWCARWTDPSGGGAAAKYAPMFRHCNVRGGGASLLALNVSAECHVNMYVLGDLGRGGGGSGCSQDAEGHAITAHFTGAARASACVGRILPPPASSTPRLQPLTPRAARARPPAQRPTSSRASQRAASAAGASALWGASTTGASTRACLPRGWAACCPPTLRGRRA